MCILGDRLIALVMCHNVIVVSDVSRREQKGIFLRQELKAFLRSEKNFQPPKKNNFVQSITRNNSYIGVT